MSSAWGIQCSNIGKPNPAPIVDLWNKVNDALFWIDADPDCPHCGGHGADFVCFDPFPMSVPCQCTCRAYRLISMKLPCDTAYIEGAD